MFKNIQNSKASRCGNSFIKNNSYGTFKYSYQNGTYSVQQVLPFLGTQMRITKDGFLQACQELIDNISLCGSSFTISSGNSVTNYWFDGMYFYKQAVGDFVRSVAVKITREEYRDACSNRF